MKIRASRVWLQLSSHVDEQRGNETYAPRIPTHLLPPCPAPVVASIRRVKGYHAARQRWGHSRNQKEPIVCDAVCDATDATCRRGAMIRL